MTPTARLRALAAATLLALVPVAGAAQDFSPVITVDGAAITGYELSQRSAMLDLFGVPGDPADNARTQLIEDRLKQAEMNRVGLSIDEGELTTAMEEFAARADMTLPQFTAFLGQSGIAEETLRDFVVVGTTWRQYVRARFGAQATISDAEVDAALGLQGATDAGIEVLLNEIIIPAPPPRAASARAEAERISQFTTFAAFEAAAREVSALPSRNVGGRLDWLPISNYPPQLRALLLALAPGEVSQPIPITNGVALFQLRDIREVSVAPATPTAIDYATFYIPGGTSQAALTEAARVDAVTDTCDDLYGVARGLPPERLDRVTADPANIAQDISLELAKLDPGESSARLVTGDGQTLIFLMLCGRTIGAEGGVDREATRSRLQSERLIGFSDALLAELRAAATIRP